MLNFRKVIAEERIQSNNKITVRAKTILNPLKSSSNIMEIRVRVLTRTLITCSSNSISKKMK